MTSYATRVAVSAIAFSLALSSATAAQRTPRVSKSNVKLLTNRVWMQTTPENGLPGVMMTFLSNGTLLQGSCWETYTLSNWKPAGASRITWTENGMPIFAELVSVSTVELVLEVGTGEAKLQHIFQAARTPFNCPDMKK
jgi:hypothetical protein